VTASTPAADAARRRPLRPWQQEALATVGAGRPRDVLIAATPGAGKTAVALTLAARLFADREIRALCVVTPTEHLKRQWANAADEFGLRLDPDFRNADGSTSRSYDGIVVTYAQVARNPALHRAKIEARPTLVVLDEIHHAGDALTWGAAVREAFDPAPRRLALTGTPFRSDDNPIPFVRYEPDGDGAARSAADVTYGYAAALRDGVVRPVIFLAYSGQLRWRTRAGDEVAARLGEPLTDDLTAQAWRTALDPAGEWIGQVLRAADRRLSEVRARGMPDAGGLVIATDRATARAYAVLLRRVSGEEPAVVLSDDPQASRKIMGFARSERRWLVAVRMVSEGVDIPRLSVGVYATSIATPLFFAQAVGRFVRARRRGETASVFLPSVPVLLGHAAALEEQRDHVLGRVELGDWDALPGEGPAAAGNGEGDGPAFVPLEASASFDRVLFDGAEFGTGAHAGSAEELDYLGLPGLLEPAQVAVLLRERQARQLAAGRRSGPAEPPAAGAIAAGPPAAGPVHERVAAARRTLAALVSVQHRRTGEAHQVIQAELRRRCGGPPTAVATLGELETRIAALRRWGGTAHR